MWHAALLRLLRRRIVLALIFCLSLTYFLVNLFGIGVSLSKDFDEVIYKRNQPLVWREELKNATLNDVVPPNCRNSIQGKTLIVDDEGYVCSRIELLNNGCCKLTLQSKQYDCNSCIIDDGCCSVYEYCVSCCLNPIKKNILEKVLEKASGRQTALFATVKDQFELCLAKCRTDSHSVQHENKYKNPNHRHCYGLTEAHESQREGRPSKVL